MLVYGGCIEPGGMELDNDTYETECPHCEYPKAVKRAWQGCEGGSVNNYWRVNCEQCGYEDGEYDEFG